MYLCHEVLVLKSINMNQVSTYTAMKIFRSELTEIPNPRHVSIHDLKVNVAYVILRLSIYIYMKCSGFFCRRRWVCAIKGLEKRAAFITTFSCFLITSMVLFCIHACIADQGSMVIPSWVCI